MEFDDYIKKYPPEKYSIEEANKKLDKIKEKYPESDDLYYEMYGLNFLMVRCNGEECFFRWEEGDIFDIKEVEKFLNIVEYKSYE